VVFLKANEKHLLYTGKKTHKIDVGKMYALRRIEGNCSDAFEKMHC
jgi:hypothetical protein